MGLNKSKGNMYDFVTHTWNAIKGMCPHDCSYCYVKRWGELNPVRLDERELRADLGIGHFIFVGSSCDIFAKNIPYEWIIKTIEHCKKFNNTYLFQSKNPKYFDLLATYNLDKFTLCTTIETNRWYPNIMRNSPKPGERAIAMNKLSGYDRYLTIEPIIDFDPNDFIDMIRMINPEQINIGADSGNNKLPEPSYDKIDALIEELDMFTTVKLKANLKRLYERMDKI